ncbi:hypothetical protein [Haliovirga abyssi]|uniref:Uncharacterized protein n=1 Tax=Haliovirga abyssi TaxID=2996794 RepID=A0AAU9DAQ8_9FUSO|nr:hypothetical protein [Haliovirga abyssi]BDU50410.1 hypothetical protein HLVA_09790 [Haliovirga abyssi]
MFEIKILEGLSKSGEYSEYNFGKTNDLLWILFLNLETGEEWIGKFDIGIRNKSKIKIFQNNTAVILARGNIYIINCKIKKVQCIFEYEDYEDIEIDLVNNYIIITDGLYISVHDKNGKFIQKTKRISLDGIEFIEIKNGNVYGRLNDLTFEWCDFKYNIVENEVISKWIFDDAVLK